MTLALALVLLLIAVTAGRGGYEPWAALVLQVGATGLALWQLAGILLRHGPERRAELLLSRRGRAHGSSADIEIFPPDAHSPSPVRATASVGAAKPASEDRFDPHRSFLILGFPAERTRVGLPLLLLTIWIALSLLPMSPESLEIFSPHGGTLRAESASLVDGQAAPERAPWSLVPFLTLRDLWLWIAYLVLFYLAFSLARRPERVERLTQWLLIAGAVVGAYGILQWLLGMHDLPVRADAPAVRASGTFGNPNHYAAWLGMLVMSSLGWVGARKTEIDARRGAREGKRSDVPGVEAKLILAGMGIVLMGLGIVLSLSRSGFTFTLLGFLALMLLTRTSTGAHPYSDQSIDLEPRPTGGHGPKRRGNPGPNRAYLAVVLALASLVAWIGYSPLVGRFQLLGEQWDRESERITVWQDSWGAVEDFWLTGSGLSSYRYISSSYRSFPGRVYYSWAHNDYLQLLIELGLPGALLSCWLILCVARNAKRVRSELVATPSVHRLHAGYLAAIIVVALHSLTDFALHMPANFALLSVMVGVAIGLTPSAFSRTNRARRRVAREAAQAPNTDRSLRSTWDCLLRPHWLHRRRLQRRRRRPLPQRR